MQRKGKLYGFVNVSHRLCQTDDAENHQLSSCLCRWMIRMDSSRDEPAIRYEIEKKKLTGMVFSKNPPMIKLEWNLIEVYRKRIQLGSSFRDENCVPFGFIPLWLYSHLVFNEQQIFAAILICNG